MAAIFQTVLMRLALCGLAASFAVLAFRSWPVRAAFARLSAIWRGLTAFGRFAVCAFLFVGVLEADKTNNVNNLPPQQMMAGGVFFQTGFTGLTGLGGVGNLVNPVNPVQTTVAQATVEDIARGWRVECVATNAAVSYAMPTNAVLVGNWHVHGAASSFGMNRISFNGFSFPLGTNGAEFSSFWYFVDGRIRPTPKDAEHEICAVGVPMSAVPGQSRLWRLDGDDGSRVITWENFFFGGDTNAPVNAQIELFETGDFITRSNGVVTVCRRVNPDDWDDDGLENQLDPNPLFCDGDFFGVANALPTNANPDAYYWLDLSVTGALGVATIRVTCDGPSDLGDHVIIARTNQVCHIPLLAGAEYAVDSNLPIGYSAVSSEYAEIVTNAENCLTVSLPLELTFERVQMRGGSDSYVAHTTPIDVGPRILAVDGGCCSCTTNDVGFLWSCSDGCPCGGAVHALSSTAVWGGYSYLFSWLERCHCYYESQDEIDEIESRGVSLEILDASGGAITWKNPILVGESVIVEATVGGSNMTVSDFVGLFGGLIRLKAYYVDFDGAHDIAGAAIPISAATATSQGQNVFHVSVAADWLQSNGIVRNADDGIAAKTSIDMSDAETGDSNRQDSDCFDASVAGRLYGRARGGDDGNSDATIPEGAMNLKTLQAAGAASLVAHITIVSSPAKQCQQQADFVYLSCHGSHATGDIADIQHNCYSCDSVAAKWGDVDIVVIAGCSVLDIGNFRAESFSTATMMKRWWAAGGNSSPGEKWESKGAKVYLGYAWTAPTDIGGGSAIASTFAGEIASGKDWIEAWRNANDCDVGRNACAIDCRNGQHVFWYWREVGGVATWTSVTKGGSSWQ